MCVMEIRFGRFGVLFVSIICYASPAQGLSQALAGEMVMERSALDAMRSSCELQRNSLSQGGGGTRSKQ